MLFASVNLYGRYRASRYIDCERLLVVKCFSGCSVLQMYIEVDLNKIVAKHNIFLFITANK